MTHRKTLPNTVSVAEMRDDGRLHAPSAERNAKAITDVLKRVAPASGRALEIASGTGQHVAGFAQAMPGLIWQPSEIVAARRGSIDMWTVGIENVSPAIELDAALPGWAARHTGVDLIVAINLLHLISDTQTRQMIVEMSQALSPSGRICIYGPFLRDGSATSDGDARFDANIRASDPTLGYKDLGIVQTWLTDAGLRVVDVIEMPANNITLIAEKPMEPA